MTTWNPARYWPELVAAAAVTFVPKRAHLMFVVEGGLVQPEPVPGMTVGSRSKSGLKVR